MDRWLNIIEHELKRVLPESSDQTWIEWVLGSSAPPTDTVAIDQFSEPARDLIRRGGKRWRPLFMMLTAKMLGGDTALALAERLVSLVELPHNGSLIVDDIEDKSDWRRGGPAMHILYGEDFSINAGNFLYFLPTKTIDEAPLDDKVKLQIYQIYAKYMRRVHMGQGMDICWHHQHRTFPSVQEYELMCRLKTGCLAAMGCEIGAAVAVDDPQVIWRAGHIAETIGVGFQILDDVINLEKGNPGKKHGDDIVENKKSLPIIMYVEENPEQVEYLIGVFQQARKDGYDDSISSIEELLGNIQASGTLGKARNRAFALFEEALQEIDSLYAPSAERDMLVSMIHRFFSA
ncbi:MAG: polyprenyl synthetase family protein [Spirochaetae bacterium HGW-Spirochaetae-2]|jgi:octaprenyl-diphosphate synthase|nr:MAG: polyprenyl synthetase family protein [Spirochaetae bacterium HGW-Spirochaetae-2]